MIGIILGVIGIVITCAFGLYSIWIYKKSKNTVSLQFRNRECYSLFSEDVNRLNIEISYNKKPLSNTLILLKARLINNGKVDIDKNRIFNPLKIKSNSDFKWLEATITSHSIGATTDIQISNKNEIQIEWDLLKKDEYIEIEALAENIGSDNSESEKAIEFYNGLVFDYRITDLNSIQNEKQLPTNEKRKNRIYKLAKVVGSIALFFGIIVLLSEIFPTYQIFPQRHIIKYGIHDGKKVKVATIKSKSAEQLQITIDNTEEELELSIKEFNEKYKIVDIKKFSISPNETIILRIFGGIYTGLGLILLILVYLRQKITNSKKRLS